MSSKLAKIALMTDNLAPLDAGEESQSVAARAFALLIERARAGDTAAFEQIMIYSQRRVVRAAWRILGNEEDARDAAQEVFLRAYKYLRRFHQDKDFDAWLYRITINVCHDIARQHRHQSGHQSGTVISLEAATAAGALEALASPDDTEAATLLAQQREMISRALATLSQKERAAIVLRDLEGLSTEEVARILGSRPTTVRSQISIARHKIKLYCDRLLHGRRPPPPPRS